MTAHQMTAGGLVTGPAEHRGRWLAAVVMITGALMDMIDVTIVNVALPSIRRDLHASATQLDWGGSGSMLAFGAALGFASAFGGGGGGGSSNSGGGSGGAGGAGGYAEKTITNPTGTYYYTV